MNRRHCQWLKKLAWSLFHALEHLIDGCQHMHNKSRMNLTFENCTQVQSPILRCPYVLWALECQLQFPRCNDRSQKILHQQNRQLLTSGRRKKTHLRVNNTTFSATNQHETFYLCKVCNLCRVQPTYAQGVTLLFCSFQILSQLCKEGLGRRETDVGNNKAEYIGG